MKPIDLNQFEKRKVDHIHLSLDENNQSVQSADFHRIDLIHDALQ
jgi:isopentenyl diphosphate isomerase/L-lactate dehydrogenase-like FMN-dependent dehydrogenase